MGAPQIQYARSSDGVRVAYWTVGSGFPLVFPPSVPFSYGRLEWQIPELREWYESFARDYMLVRYDNRGTGLSDRNITEHTVEAMANDLEGVVDHLSLERFALFGMGHSGAVSIAYTVRHPERVTRLMLWAAYAQATEYLQRPRLEALSTALNEDRAATTLDRWGVESSPARSRPNGRLPGGKAPERYGGILGYRTWWL